MKRPLIKISTILLAFGVATLLVAACGEETSEVIGILKSNGFNVGPESDERLVYIGAPQDTSVKVNGRQVLIYRFPDRDDLREGVIAIEDIIKAGTGLWGYDPENPRRGLPRAWSVHRLLRRPPRRRPDPAGDGQGNQVPSKSNRMKKSSLTQPLLRTL